MTAVTTLLAPVKARAEKATPGPWEHDPDGYMGCGSVYATHEDIWGCNIAAPDGDLYPRSGYSPKEDMAFIAAARTDVPRLVAALEAVVKVHEPIDAAMYSGAQQRKVRVCTGCGTDDGNWQRWPCPTITAMVAALGEGEGL